MNLAVSLTTNGRWEISVQEQHVLACFGGGTLAVLTRNTQLLGMKSLVGCDGESSFSSSADIDPISSLLSGILS